MPRPARPWFRFYVEAFNDRKLLRLTPAQRWIWVAVLGAARESPTPGVLLIAEGVPMTRCELARYADVRERDVDAALGLMESLGMVDQGEPITVRNWSERQYESDNVAERTRRHRSKERGRNVPTPLQGTSVGTGQRTETEKDITPIRKRTASKEPKKGYTKAERDPIFSALVELFGPASTDVRRAFYGQTVTGLLDAGATVDDVKVRGACLLAKGWEDCTPNALLKHWDTLGAPRATTNGLGKLDPDYFDRLSRGTL